MSRKQKAGKSARGPQIVVGVALLIMAILGVIVWQGNQRQAADRARNPPRLTSFVQDAASIIDRDESMAMEAKLRAFDRLGGPQLVVATRYTLDKPIEEEALSLARAWRIGRAGQNNGVLLLLVQRDHKARIEVGYGLEGVLTDALSRIIIANDIEPALQAGDFTRAAHAGVEAILAKIHDGPVVVPEPAGPSLGDRLGEAFFMLIIGLIAIGIVQAIVLAIPGVEKRVLRSHGFGWFARIRVLGGAGGGGSSGSSSGGSSVGGGGSFGGGGSSN